MWKRFQDLQGGVLVVGHGTRVPRGAEQLIELASQLQSQLGNVPLESGFLELAEPTISDAMNRLRLRGVGRVLVIPILLFEAAHAQSDIPTAVQRAAESLGLSIVAQSPPLGTEEAALSLSEFRFVDALNFRYPAVSGSLENAGRVGLAMVGRGTSDQTALEHMRQFTAMRVARSQIPLSWVQTGFFAGGEPSVDRLLENALRSPCDTVVIQPHLLFEGELVRQLREKVQQCQQISKDRRWLVTPTLGADPRLAGAFYALASHTLSAFLRANSCLTHVATGERNS